MKTRGKGGGVCICGHRQSKHYGPHVGSNQLPARERIERGGNVSGCEVYNGDIDDRTSFDPCHCTGFEGAGQ